MNYLKKSIKVSHMLQDFFLLLMVCLAFILSFSASTLAGSLESCKTCFRSISGWKAGEVTGMNMSYSDVHMITAARTYSKGDKKLQVNFISGAAPGIQPDIDKHGKFEMETSEGFIRTRIIKGKPVIIVYDKSDRSSTISIVLEKPAKGEAGPGSVLNFIGTNLTADELLKMAMGFDWSCFEKEGHVR